MSQAPNEETQAAEESSMQITVVDPSAQAAKLRLLGKPLPPVEEPDPSSEDVIVIPASAPRRGRARRYREERV